MDAEKLIQAAEYCAIEAHETCEGCPMYDDCPADDRDPVDIAMRLLAIRDHVKAEVIAQVREWITTKLSKPHTAETSYALEIMLGMKLDELAGDER